ncbi:hypothetical protein ABH924_003304 [Arthrobacter sp. GAS37]|uniref:hypothetical protein n=1 Tax=Arthrobacter sp. GAS37 TaxID=3156261 RepID=UPI00383890DD
MSQGEPMVASFYTAARRIKTLIGELNGTRLPGGPYSITQVVIAVAVLGLGLTLMQSHLISTGLGLFDIAIVLGSAWGIAWIAGKLPHTKRNPLWVINDAFAATVAPAKGKVAGEVFSLRKPHQAKSLMMTDQTPEYRASADPAPDVDPAPEPEVSPAVDPGRSLVQLPDPATPFQNLLARINSNG